MAAQPPEEPRAARQPELIQAHIKARMAQPAATAQRNRLRSVVLWVAVVAAVVQTMTLYGQAVLVVPVFLALVVGVVVEEKVVLEQVKVGLAAPGV